MKTGRAEACGPAHEAPRAATPGQQRCASPSLRRLNSCTHRLHLAAAQPGTARRSTAAAALACSMKRPTFSMGISHTSRCTGPPLPSVTAIMPGLVLPAASVKAYILRASVCVWRGQGRAEGGAERAGQAPQGKRRWRAAAAATERRQRWRRLQPACSRPLPAHLYSGADCTSRTKVLCRLVSCALRGWPLRCRPHTAIAKRWGAARAAIVWVGNARAGLVSCGGTGRARVGLWSGRSRGVLQAGSRGSLRGHHNCDRASPAAAGPSANTYIKRHCPGRPQLGREGRAALPHTVGALPAPCAPPKAALCKLISHSSSRPPCRSPPKT